MRSRHRRAGVNLAGYFAAELGVGELGRMLVEATEAAGLRCVTRTYRRTRSRQEEPFEERRGALHPVTVAVVTAHSFPQWAEDEPDLVAGRRVIGVWPWEVDRFRQYPKAFKLVDEVWTISEYCRAAIAARTDKPVHVIPLPTRVPPTAEPLDRSALGLDTTRPYFLFAFDYLSVLRRKNPTGLVEAFARAFPDADGPMLVLKSVNGHLIPRLRDLVHEAVGGREDILLVEDYLPRPTVGALMAECLAYVSLHRSEGYGHTLAEAMVRGRPVIATAYSGNVDFMDDSTALLVPWTPVRVGKSQVPYPAGATWADPDLDAAAAHLRWVVDHPDEVRALGERARAHHLEHRTVARAAAFVKERVETGTR